MQQIPSSRPRLCDDIYERLCRDNIIVREIRYYKLYRSLDVRVYMAMGRLGDMVIGQIQEEMQ